MNNALMNAILSMDAYNRGYGSALTFGNNPGNNNYSLDIQGTKLGAATIITNSSILLKDNNGNPNVDDDISFYALAYSYNGETIISYRGTDNFSLLSGDPRYGWPLGGGLEAPQGQMAIDFFNEVSDITNTHMTLTGHSLGGGLAGLVSANDNYHAIKSKVA